MNISCTSCSATYRISVSVPPGRSIETQCQRCSSMIRSRAPSVPAASSMAPTLPGVTAKPAPVSDTNERVMWCVDAGATIETMATFPLWVAIAAGDLGPDVRVWREGLECWTPVGDVPELACALVDHGQPPHEVQPSHEGSFALTPPMTEGFHEDGPSSYLRENAFEAPFSSTGDRDTPTVPCPGRSEAKPKWRQSVAHLVRSWRRRRETRWVGLLAAALMAIAGSRVVSAEGTRPAEATPVAQIGASGALGSRTAPVCTEPIRKPRAHEAGDSPAPRREDRGQRRRRAGTSRRPPSPALPPISGEGSADR